MSSPQVTATSSYMEGSVSGLSVTNAEAPVILTTFSSSELRRSLGADGKIDVRNYVRGTILLKVTDFDVDAVVQYYRTSKDTDPQVLVASATYTAGTTTELYADTLEYISHIVVKCSNTVADSVGVIELSILCK